MIRRRHSGSASASSVDWCSAQAIGTCLPTFQRISVPSSWGSSSQFTAWPSTRRQYDSFRRRYCSQRNIPTRILVCNVTVYDYVIAFNSHLKTPIKHKQCSHSLIIRHKWEINTHIKLQIKYERPSKEASAVNTITFKLPVLKFTFRSNNILDASVFPHSFKTFRKPCPTPTPPIHNSNPL